MMRLSRVTVQTTESETGGDGSAWVEMLLKRQSGEQRQSSDGMEPVSKRKTWTVWFWLAMRQAQGPFSTSATISTVHTLPADSPPSDMLQKLFVMLPSAGVKSTFHLFDHNT
jgi:hypothetical protein